MVAIRTNRVVRAPAGAAWAALVDWPAHGRWVPLTRVHVLTATGDGVGARFVGRTGIGPLAFDDPMEVVEWVTPPEPGPSAGERGGRAGGYRCTVVKQGRVVLGRAWFTVVPVPGGCRVTWAEDVEVAPVRLTRLLTPLIAAAGRAGFARMLAAMAAEVEAPGAG